MFGAVLLDKFKPLVNVEFWFYFFQNYILQLSYIQTLPWRAEPTGATITLEAHLITSNRTAFLLLAVNLDSKTKFDPYAIELRYELICGNNLPINPLHPELNPICFLLALLGAHHFLHVSRIRVKLLTLRRLMSYVYAAPILDVSRSHTTTQHSR